MTTTGELTATPPLSSPARSRSRRRSPRLLDGAEGNARLTSLAGALLVVLLAVEGTTLPFLGSLLSVHVFVGLLLLGPVALKLASTGYRFLRYYGGARDYVAGGPPMPLMRVVVAPVLVLSTLTLLGSGVGLVLAPSLGLLRGLHSASFVVWSGAFGIHLLVYGLRAGRHLLAELGTRAAGGRELRIALLLAALGAGIAVALVVFPHAAPWLHGTMRFGG